jgi:hypothetical protein
MIDDSQVYVWDKFLCKVNIYSKDNMKKVAHFGKKGEGPGEFRVINSSYLDNECIYINAYPKLCIFSKDGKLLEEKRSSFEIGSFMPIGNHFIGKKHPFTPPAQNSKVIYVLFDSSLKKIKEIFEAEYMREVTDINPSKMKVLWFKDCCRGVVYKDRFYVAATNRGFFFTVFDGEGNKLYEIQKHYQKRKITKEIKETLLNNVRKDYGDEGWKSFAALREIVFPEYFPAFVNFAIDDNCIYVFKYPLHKARTLEVLVLDLHGNFVKRMSLPANYWKGLEENMFYLYNGRLYSQSK